MVRRAEVRAEARHFKQELLGALFGAAADAPAARLAAGEALGLPRRGNVVGVGYGAKLVGSRIADELAVRVYVRAKRPRADLAVADRVPAEIDGRATDVVAVGDLRALRTPVDCGVSVGHVDITAGTIGSVVEVADAPGERLILSNNHVLANSNGAVPGDAILQPGPLDGGDPDDPIGVLHRFVPIGFDDTAANRVDAAVARLHDPDSVRPQIVHIGPPVLPPVDASLYQSVRKHGRTTEHTVGVIVDLAADIEVRFGTRTAAFADQLAVLGVGGDPFSDGGDSGSLIVDAVDRNPVALLFAGGGGTTFGNPIGEVLDALDATIVGTDATADAAAPANPPVDVARLQTAKEHARATLGGRPGVRGLGIGDGCVRVYVSDAAVARHLPADVDGVRLECVEVGDVTAHDADAW